MTQQQDTIHHDSSRLAVPVNESDHIEGDLNAPIKLVQYADYECPYSRLSNHAVRGLRQRLGDKIAFVYRNFPLRDIHPHAEKAAEVAEAAARQGQFWEMHDYLFAHQSALDEEHLVDYARTLSLDADQLKLEVDSGVYRSRVEADRESGIESGVESTPTFFINGVRYEGPYDLDSMAAAVEQQAQG